MNTLVSLLKIYTKDYLSSINCNTCSTCIIYITLYSYNTCLLCFNDNAVITIHIRIYNLVTIYIIDYISSINDISAFVLFIDTFLFLPHIS